MVLLQEFIWDENLVPGEYYQGENPLALPKLNLQFLTLHDYLLRNFKLFQLESTYEIRLVLTLPQLNLQFLILHDYLLRNFKLFQLESTYEISSAAYLYL